MKSHRPKRRLQTLAVRRAPLLPGQPGPRGVMRLGSQSLTCGLGSRGVTHAKREGDKATPAAQMRIIAGFFRADRMSRPHCRIPLQRLPPNLVWCDDPHSPVYNRSKNAPLSASHEEMWRADELYDLVFVLDYNLAPRRVGRGSAIFLHCAKPGFQSTLGCIALRPADMRRLLPQLARHARVIVR